MSTSRALRLALAFLAGIVIGWWLGVALLPL